MFWLVATILLLVLSAVFTSTRLQTRDITIPNKPSTDEAASVEDKNLYDIYHVVFLLRQKLCSDVIPSILHHGGFFQRKTYTFKPAGILRINQQSSPHTCLLTPVIQSSARVKHPVRKVAFIIYSADQGFASDPDAGSWTWFTAARVPKDAEGGDEMLHAYVSRHDGNDERFLDHERQIFRNSVACSEIKIHAIEWSSDSEDESERRWVRSLENGNRIAVRAWAQYPAWVNHIRTVSVVISTQAVI